MSFYLHKIPFLIQKLYPQRIWKIDTDQTDIFLTFDDGPHPDITPYILDILSKFHAKVTFFQLGSKVIDFPDLHKRCKDEGHAIGNHGFHHFSSYETTSDRFIKNIEEGNQTVQSCLYRPAYGRLPIRRKTEILKKNRVIMWDVMPGDFDKNMSEQKCFETTINHISKGSIIVLHENDMSKKKVLGMLHKILEYYTKFGYSFKPLSTDIL